MSRSDVPFSLNALLTSLTTFFSMAFSTMTAAPAASGPGVHVRPTALRLRFTTASGLLLLTLGVLLVHGWHPYVEDAGIYDAGILHLLHPRLFQPDAPFVSAHTRLSIFAPVIAAIAAVTHLPLTSLLLATHVASIILFLTACRSVAARLFPRAAEIWCATAMAAACFTLPIAGTSLFLMDPYVTARSFSTPLSLFALAAVLDSRWIRALLLLALTLLLHPLMGLYAGAFLTMAAVAQLGLPRVSILLACEYLLAGAILFLTGLRSPASAAYHQAVASRSYLLLSRWELWEWLGLLAPALLFRLAAYNKRMPIAARRLAWTASLAAVTATVAGMLFLHPAGSMLLVRLQPLRSFQVVYAVGVLLAGGMLGRLGFSSTHGRRAQAMVCILIAVVASIFYLAQRMTTPYSAHIEWPGEAPHNPWQQAFAWARQNTPQDAVFAADPDLVLQPGEDAQSFRAMTGRSLLADYKDEGVVVVFPQLAEIWHRQYRAQENIERLSDAERKARLQPFGVSWLLLPIRAQTDLDCPYRNVAAQICRLP